MQQLTHIDQLLHRAFGFDSQLSSITFLTDTLRFEARQVSLPHSLAVLRWILEGFLEQQFHACLLREIHLGEELIALHLLVEFLKVGDLLSHLFH